MRCPCAFQRFAPELGHSSSDQRVHFGLRASESAREIEIRWLSDFHRIIRHVKADQSVIETESAKFSPRVARGLESFEQRGIGNLGAPVERGGDRSEARFAWRPLRGCASQRPADGLLLLALRVVQPLWLYDKPRYVREHMFPQFKDLVTLYKPSIIFSDGEWELPSADWHSAEKILYLKKHSKRKAQG